MREEIATLYAGLDLRSPDMPKAGPDELNPPSGAFIVGYEDGVAICCGGIKRLDADTCELKRMYVIPEARGRGVARLLLAALEERGRELGYTIARLDTGPSSRAPGTCTSRPATRRSPTSTATPSPRSSASGGSETPPANG